MSKAQISQETGSAQQNFAENVTNEASPIIAAEAPKTSRANRSSKSRRSRKPKPKPRQNPASARPAVKNATGKPAPVQSVADLMIGSCRNPENRRKRLKMSEAYREFGLDEPRLAAYLFGMAEKLSRNEENGAVGVANSKLLLEVLKEVADSLEPHKTSGVNDSSDAPQFVRLVHNIPRPVRTE
jgi:hypothetical protein